MKKIVHSMVSIILALSMILPFTSVVLAADNITPVESPLAVPQVLMIRVKDVADVGQPVNIQVWSKYNPRPVSGAAVFALKASALPVISTSATATIDYPSIAKEKGIFIGYTNNGGIIDYKFSEPDKYLLVAIKEGYIPGTAWIAITLAGKKGLTIISPDFIEVGKELVFKVVDRDSSEGVAAADLYAMKIGEINAPTVFGSSSEDITKYAAEVKNRGIFIGQTNADGKVIFTFKQTGHYVLIALKASYASGFDRIDVTLASSKALAIKSPDRVVVGKSITFTVFDRTASQPVADAKVFALKIGDFILPGISTNSVKQGDKNTKEIEANVTITSLDYIAEAQKRGFSIGTTDSNGEVSYIFKETGRYVIVAVKDGYLPAYTKLEVILAEQQTLAIKTPGSVEVNKPVTMYVFERSSGKPVATAAVYALKIGETPIPIPMPLPVKPLPVPTINSTVTVPVPTLSVNATVLPKIIQPLIAQSNNYTDEAIAKGTLIGYSGNDGKIEYTFTQTGRYILVATKEGYVTGTAWFNVTLTHQVQNTLRVKSPSSATIGQQVTFAVYDKNTYKPVAEASVYALKIQLTAVSVVPSTGNGTAIQKIIEAIPIEKEAAMYAEDAQKSGILIGTTNSNGEVSYTFQETGRYVIVAVKDSYIPGYAKIDINHVSEKALNVTVPPVGEVKRPITVKVTEKRTNKPVAKAAVYTLKIAEITEVKPLPEVLTTESDEKGIAGSYAAMAKEKGSLIGYTDDNGKISYQYTQTGHYLVIAVKDEYTPGFGQIKIQLTLIDKLTIKAPADGIVNEPVTLTVLDKNTGKGLEQVGVYAFKIEGFFNSIGMVFREAFASDASSKTNFATDVSGDGFFVDYTDENGNITYSFDATGSYMLVAIKAGYAPDFAKININSAK